MVNSEKFAKRLEKIMGEYDLTASAFADHIDVGRSSISHILSGRNKPSLDFVMKIVETFPEVELYWLLNGKGNFPTKAHETVTSNKENDLFTNHKSTVEDEVVIQQKPEDIPDILKKSVKTISRIVIFYKDGTFENFTEETE